LNGCGIKYLMTSKIFWAANSGEKFPYHYFKWLGMDGSKITTFLPTNYGYDANPAELINLWENVLSKNDGNFVLDKCLLPFGYGDGGGGPCRDHMEYILREVDLEGCPKVKFASPLKFFRDLEKDGEPDNTYAGELYLSSHRGVYTSQAAIKKGNRRSELALRECEMWGAVAAWSGYPYPYEKMDGLWKKTLLNQFHDILPGSSIKRVNETAEKAYAEILEGAGKIIGEATESLIGSGDSTVIFNSLSWDRNAVIGIDGKNVFVTVPSCGYTAVNGETAITGFDDGRAVRVEASDYGYILENRLVRAEIDGYGEINSLILKESGREFAAGTMNLFHLYKDIPRVNDAWDIDSPYELEEVPIICVPEIELLYADSLKAAVKVTKRITETSSVIQIISLSAESGQIEFDTSVDWNEQHRMLKAGFPINVRTTEGINEIQFGYIKRPTHRSREYDKGFFEVPSHRYTSLCDESHGAAVLNDCKYGVSMLDDTVSLTLLRSAVAPERHADSGRVHRFTYAFTAWEGSFYGSPVVREGYELNVPPIVKKGNSETKSLLRITNCDNIIIDTVKPAEDGSGDVVLRLYESKHADCRCELKWELPVKSAAITDMTEKETEALAIGNDGVGLHFKPFEIKTIRLKKINGS